MFSQYKWCSCYYCTYNTIPHFHLEDSGTTLCGSLDAVLLSIWFGLISLSVIKRIQLLKANFIFRAKLIASLIDKTRINIQEDTSYNWRMCPTGVGDC